MERPLGFLDALALRFHRGLCPGEVSVRGVEVILELFGNKPLEDYGVVLFLKHEIRGVLPMLDSSLAVDELVEPVGEFLEGWSVGFGSAAVNILAEVRHEVRSRQLGLEHLARGRALRQNLLPRGHAGVQGHERLDAAHEAVGVVRESGVEERLRREQETREERPAGVEARAGVGQRQVANSVTCQIGKPLVGCGKIEFSLNRLAD